MKSFVALLLASASLVAHAAAPSDSMVSGHACHHAKAQPNYHAIATQTLDAIVPRPARP